MARFCWLPPTKRPPKDTRVHTKQKESPSSSKTPKSTTLSKGMLKRLEPVFIPKNRLYKRGVRNYDGDKKEEDTSQTPTNFVQDESQLKAKHAKPKSKKSHCNINNGDTESQKSQKNSICRALFPSETNRENDSLSILEIVDENSREEKCTDVFGFFDENHEKLEENECASKEHEKMCKKKKEKKGGTAFKKPMGKPVLSRKTKQKRVNQSVIEIIRKTQQSIQEIRDRTKKNEHSDTYSDINFKDKSKTHLNVQVSMCVPNKGIQKSKCTVQESGSIEDETIGYQHEKIKSYKDIENLL